MVFGQNEKMIKEEVEEHIQKKIAELSVPILSLVTLEEIENFQHYNIRYYEDKYCVSYNTELENNDVLLRFHTNKLSLISLAFGHDIFRHKKTIEKIDFNVNGENLLDISISGKRKNGAKKLKKESVLCHIKCQDDEKQYPIYTSVPASLIEVNNHILKDPQLLVTDYKGLGYIGVLFPHKIEMLSEKLSKLNLLTEKEYSEYIENRK